MSKIPMIATKQGHSGRRVIIAAVVLTLAGLAAAAIAEEASAPAPVTATTPVEISAKPIAHFA